MSIEQSLDNIAAAINNLAVAITGQGAWAAPAAAKVQSPKQIKEEAPPAEGKPGKAPPAGARAEKDPAPSKPTAEASAAATEKALSYEADIKPLFQKLVGAKGRDVGLAFIAKYNDTPGCRLPDAITEAQYPEVKAALLAQLEE